MENLTFLLRGSRLCLMMILNLTDLTKSATFQFVNSSESKFGEKKLNRKDTRYVVCTYIREGPYEKD